MNWMILLALAIIWPPVMALLLRRRFHRSDKKPLGERPVLLALMGFVSASLAMFLASHIGGA